MRRPLALLALIAAIAGAPAAAQRLLDPPISGTTAGAPGIDEQTLIFREVAQGRMTVPVTMAIPGRTISSSIPVRNDPSCRTNWRVYWR